MKKMKKILPIPLLLILIAFATSCKDNFQLRVKNEYPVTVNNLNVGPASYGNVANSETSSYKEVKKGDNSVSGNTSNGNQLSGNVSITGRGKHKFTMTITSSGGVSIKEDK